MVVLSESYVQHLESKATAEVLIINTTPKTFRRYVDDSHTRFNIKENSRKFSGNLKQTRPSNST